MDCVVLLYVHVIFRDSFHGCVRSRTILILINVWNVLELKSAVGCLIALEKGGVLALEANRVLVLPNRFISWGFADRSIRIGSIDSDRVCHFY